MKKAVSQTREAKIVTDDPALAGRAIRVTKNLEGVIGLVVKAVVGMGTFPQTGEKYIILQGQFKPGKKKCRIVVSAQYLEPVVNSILKGNLDQKHWTQLSTLLNSATKETPVSKEDETYKETTKVHDFIPTLHDDNNVVTFMVRIRSAVSRTSISAFFRHISQTALKDLSGYVFLGYTDKPHRWILMFECVDPELTKREFEDRMSAVKQCDVLSISMGHYSFSPKSIFMLTSTTDLGSVRKLKNQYAHRDAVSRSSLKYSDEIRRELLLPPGRRAVSLDRSPRHKK